VLGGFLSSLSSCCDPTADCLSPAGHQLPSLCSPDAAYLAVLADIHRSLPWNFVRNRLCACFRPTFDGRVQFLSCERNFPSSFLPFLLYFSVFSVFIFPSYFLYNCSCSYFVSFFLLLLFVEY